MNNFEHIYRWIDRYNEDDLEGEELARFKEILNSNQEISRLTKLDQAVNKFLKDKDLLEFRNLINEVRNMKFRGFGLNCLMLAAIILILVSLTCIWMGITTSEMYHRFSISSKVSGHVVKNSSKEKDLPDTHVSPLWKQKGFPGFVKENRPPANEQFAANFTPFPAMEGLIGIMTRSVLFRLDKPALSLQVHQGDRVLFHWNQTGNQTLSFEMITNKGVQIFYNDGLKGLEMTLDTKSYSPGLYYWKFLVDDELICAGKIAIH